MEELIPRRASAAADLVEENILSIAYMTRKKRRGEGREAFNSWGSKSPSVFRDWFTLSTFIHP
jgi:hypothetical protein